MNTFGRLLRLTTFGESHGPACGGVLDGCPAGVEVDLKELQEFVNLRSPGHTCGTTSRKEADIVELLSGIYNGVTTGASIGFIIRNTDVRPADYSHIANAYRPNHADYTYDTKYGIRDPRGGGRASARETVSRIVGGGIARALLSKTDIRITAWTSEIAGIKYFANDVPTRDDVYSSPLRCPDSNAGMLMADAIAAASAAGDTLGGCIDVCVENLRAGLGSPVFGKLQSILAAAMMSIPAAKAFEYGDGFESSRSSGTEQQDTFISTHGKVSTLSNHSGGIQGGITNGMPVRFRVGLKPIATLGQEMKTIDVEGNDVVLPPRGRHDVCAVPRAVAVAEAMTWFVIADAWLASRLDRL